MDIIELDAIKEYLEKRLKERKTQIHWCWRVIGNIRATFVWVTTIVTLLNMVGVINLPFFTPLAAATVCFIAITVFSFFSALNKLRNYMLLGRYDDAAREELSEEIYNMFTYTNNIGWIVIGIISSWIIFGFLI